MWGPGAGDGGGGGGSAAAGTGGAAAGSATAESANEKARLHLSERLAAAAAEAASVQSGYENTAAFAAGGGGELPASLPYTATAAARPFSAVGYRQSVPSIGLSSQSSSATATPLYSPEDWSRHLPPVATPSLSFATPPSASAASSPSAQRLAEFHFAGAGSGGAVSGAGGGSQGQWQPHSSASPLFAQPYLPSSSTSSPFLPSPAAPRGSLLPSSHSSHSSPYSASPSLLSPSSSSVSRDEDIWAMEVAKINRQAARQQYAAQHQQQQHSSTPDPFVGSSVPAAGLSASSSSLSAAAVPAVPLGPPISRASSAQSKLLSLLSRSEDEALKRQQQYFRQPPRRYQPQQPPLHVEQSMPHQQSPAPLARQLSPQQQYQQRRGSESVVQYGSTGSEQPAASMFAAPRRVSPSAVFDAPPPSQSRSSSTPQTQAQAQTQTGSGLMAVAGGIESGKFAYGKKPVTARSPSPRSISASQPFQPRESYSGLASFPSYAYSPPHPMEQQRPHSYSSMADPLAMQQLQRTTLLTAPLEPPPSLSGLRSAPLSPTSAEVAAAANAYLMSETEQSTAEHSALSSFLTRGPQPQQHAAAAHSFDWPLSQQQQQQLLAVEQRLYPAYGMSQVQSVAVHHILADQAEQSQQQQQQRREQQGPQFPSSGQPMPATAPVSVAQPRLSQQLGRHSPVPSLLPSHFNPPVNPLAPPASVFSASSASSTPSASSLSPFAALQVLAASGVIQPASQPLTGYEAAAPATAGLGGQAATDPVIGSMFTDAQLQHLLLLQQQHLQQQHQQQQRQQQPAAPSVELPFFTQSRPPWLLGQSFNQSDFSPEPTAFRHRSFIAVGGMASEAEARVKEEEDDAEMERLLAQQMQQQQQQQQLQQRQHQPQVQLQSAAKLEPHSHPVYQLAGSSASEEQRQQQEQRYYVPAPSPTLGVPSDLSLLPPVFSSSAPDAPRFSSSSASSEPTAQLEGELGAVGYAGTADDVARRQSFQSSGLGGSIPTFSSTPSDQRLPPQPSSVFSSQTNPLVPSSASSPSNVGPSTKRRAAGAVSSAELWVCPFNCNKVYRTTSSRSIARHLQNCPNKPLYESFLAAGRAAGLEAGYGLGKRKQKKRRKNSELLEHERWNCPNGCGTFFRSTSTKSIHRHKRTCRFGQAEASKGASEEEPPDDDDDEGEGEGEGEEDEQRGEDDDEGGQGDDDADDDDEDDDDNDEKRSDMQTQQTTQTMQAPHQQRTGSAVDVDEVASQLMGLTLSSARARAQFVTPTTARRAHHAHGDSLPSSAERERDEQGGEYKRPHTQHANSRSSSTPPLFVPATAVVSADTASAQRLPYRRHSFDSSTALLVGSDMSQPRTQKQPDEESAYSYSYSPGATVSHRKNSHSGTESGGSGSKNSQQSSGSAALSSSSESSTSSSSSSSSAASSSSSSAASSSPHSNTHTPQRTSPATAQRSLATTAQRSAVEGGWKQKRRASSHDTSVATSSTAVLTAAAQQHKAQPASSSSSSTPSHSLSSATSTADSATSASKMAVTKSRSVRQLQLDTAPEADMDSAENKGRDQKDHYTRE